VPSPCYMLVVHVCIKSPKTCVVNLRCELQRTKICISPCANNNKYLVVPGQNGCGLTANQPSGVITIPMAEINNKQFQPILNAMTNGTVLTATLTSEGTVLIFNRSCHKIFPRHEISATIRQHPEYSAAAILRHQFVHEYGFIGSGPQYYCWGAQKIVKIYISHKIAKSKLDLHS
jgi:hypothetical protein